MGPTKERAVSEKNDLIRMFMDTLDPQARFNMEVAVRLDELERSERRYEDEEDIDEETYAVEIIALTKTQARLDKEMKILRGALEETVLQLREYQRQAQQSGDQTASAQRAVQETQSRASVGVTPSGQRSRAKQFRGVYCRNCGKRLEGKYQTVFCSRKCGAKWRADHAGQTATPRLTLKDEKLGTTVVAGEGVRDPR
jgi:hypothetical protein